jgi:hypothetical protein
MARSAVRWLPKMLPAWLALFVLVATAPASALSASGGAEKSREAASVRSYRLWRAVPSEHFAVLGEGVVRDLRWGLYVFRGKGRDGKASPCIQEVDVWIDGSYSAGVECGPLAPPAEWPVYTMTSTSVSGSDGASNGGASVLGMTVGLDVLRATTDFGPGPSQTRKTRLLSATQAKKARLSQFRYLAFDVARQVCLEGVTGYSRSNSIVLDTNRYDCSRPSQFVPHG